MLASTSKMLRLQRVSGVGKRTYHDLVNLPTQKPVISYGPPGYSAVSGHTVTVFGATGFLGRYLVSKLGKLGTQVIVPYRDEDDSRIFKPMGDLGQIVRMEWDIRSEQQIAECVRHSDIVFNLVGRDYETKNFKFGDVHIEGAERIAKVCAAEGVPRFVQVSHLNASATSQSKFYQTKAEGEERVKAAFPTATVMRPGPMYGYEDRLLNNMAFWSIWWKLNQAETRIRPVHVFDVAQALANQVANNVSGRTLSLPGPSTLTYEYLLDLISSVTLRPPSRAPMLPKPIALAAAKLAQSVWWPALSPDEVIRRYIDDSDVPGDWEVVGVNPTEIESHAIKYLRRYRTAENYVRPAVIPPRPSAKAIVEEY
ncbi:39kDa subunit of NdufA9, NADH ubiquinone oxidoreductase [Agaricus bisporus var. burnettii JB137-S8]|uniref:39kDa subunit of NdufA9, NADH ubiquinone oxidoreductase n=2 Tax=Agaricus bisporus var. burnettii TaxID=192524 RepID=K5VY45_AGABU|nr:39kDa subunit of NdufA9, NADH ubiquinone oxidoreductase [Agaricus bisporus var. burnettii JB137-S8]EKM79409.1 39kDa subunit of NdufA9, NADH ubiquinone oxidoreductase [Agaricus bisporus var. burnettii JB137-S8]